MSTYFHNKGINRRSAFLHFKMYFFVFTRCFYFDAIRYLEDKSRVPSPNLCHHFTFWNSFILVVKIFWCRSGPLCVSAHHDIIGGCGYRSLLWKKESLSLDTVLVVKASKRAQGTMDMCLITHKNKHWQCVESMVSQVSIDTTLKSVDPIAMELLFLEVCQKKICEKQSFVIQGKTNVFLNFCHYVILWQRAERQPINKLLT